MYSLPVYHVNTSDNIQNYINNTVFLDSKEAGDWLGAGMYFWDNLSNSKYWYAIKTHQHFGVDFSAVKVQQQFEEEDLLDLTDKDTISKVLSYSGMLQKRKGTNGDVSVHMGALLNAIYAVMQESPEFIPFSFSVIKGIGLYKKTRLEHNEGALWDESLSRTPHLTHYMKTIYLFKHDKHVVMGSKSFQPISL